MIARLVECTDNERLYGILIVEGVSTEKVQKKIYEIKNRFYEEGFKNWTIKDVLNEFPKEWRWSCDTVIDLIEI